MANGEETETIEVKPREAQITFIIPAYVDKEGKEFNKTLIISTKKAYAVFKRLSEQQSV